MLKAPCKECNSRYLACHDHCEKYKEFDVERKRLHDLEKKHKQTTYDYYKVRNYHVRKDNRK